MIGTLNNLVENCDNRAQNEEDIVNVDDEDVLLMILLKTSY